MPELRAQLATSLGGARDSAQLAYVYAVSGRRQQATAILRELLVPDADRYAPPFHIAMAYVGLGDADEAFRWLERAYEEQDPWLGVGFTDAPAFAPLRSDPRFAELVRRIGLVP